MGNWFTENSSPLATSTCVKFEARYCGWHCTGNALVLGMQERESEEQEEEEGTTLILKLPAGVSFHFLTVYLSVLQ